MILQEKNKKKQIVFLEPWPTPMIYKIAKLFKKNGYSTVSIRVLEYQFLKDDFFKDTFDKVISFNLVFYRINAKNIPIIFSSIIKKSRELLKAVASVSKLRPYVIICRTTPNWLCALTKLLFKKYPLIYFPYDIRSQGDTRLEGYNIVASGKLVKDKLPKFEIKAERFCFEKSDGVMHKGAPEELEYLDKSILGKDFKICPLQLHFPPYCSKDFILPLNKNKLSKKDNEIHIVTVESSGSTRSGTPAPYLVEYAKLLAEQKIHLHAYVLPNTSSEKEIMNAFQESYSNILDARYFHLHPPLGPKDIIKEISKYDYGSQLVNLDLKDAAEITSHKFATGNKMASYLEAGIPFLYYKHLGYVDRLMSKYGLDFSYEDKNEIKKLNQKIKKLNYKELEKNVVKAREDFLMEKNFPRLEKFIQEVVNKKRAKK